METELASPALPRSTSDKLHETIYLLRPALGGIGTLIAVVIVAYVLSFAKTWFSGISELEWVAALIIVFGCNISNKLDDFFDPKARKYRRKYQKPNCLGPASASLMYRASRPRGFSGGWQPFTKSAMPRDTDCVQQYCDSAFIGFLKATATGVGAIQQHRNTLPRLRRTPSVE